MTSPAPTDLGTYLVGSKPDIHVALYQNGVLADPGGLTYKLFPPVSQTLTTYTYGTNSQLVRDAAGSYHVSQTLSEVGTYKGRWDATGQGQVPIEFTIEVVPTQDSHLYP